MPKLNRKILVIASVVLIVLVAIISIVLSSQNKKEGVDLDSGKYYDKNSGETISNPPGKTPDTYGVPANQPIYLGLGVFYDAGLSETQITRLKYAFTNYSTQSKKNIKEVSIDVDSLSYGARPTKTEPFSLSFNVTFDRKDTYKAKIEYKALEDMHLYLYDQKTGAQIYDSGVLDSETKT